MAKCSGVYVVGAVVTPEALSTGFRIWPASPWILCRRCRPEGVTYGRIIMRIISSFDDVLSRAD